jgi:hypothetical protein
LDCCFQKDAR